MGFFVDTLIPKQTQQSLAACDGLYRQYSLHARLADVSVAILAQLPVSAILPSTRAFRIEVGLIAAGRVPRRVSMTRSKVHGTHRSA
jgi:hypothetical protein